MKLVQCAKVLDITVERFFYWAWERTGHLYRSEQPPEQAYKLYKMTGMYPAYVRAMIRSVRLAETFKKIRARYAQAPY